MRPIIIHTLVSIQQFARLDVMSDIDGERDDWRLGHQLHARSLPGVQLGHQPEQPIHAVAQQLLLLRRFDDHGLGERAELQ